MLLGIRKPSRVAVFISGAGSTLQALLEMQHQISVSLIVTNRKKATGILKAKRFGCPILFLPNPISYEWLNQELQKFKIDRLFLAGFMKILPEDFVKSWENKIDNIHPSLLPQYPGLEASVHSWNEKREVGVTIHQVVAQIDAGPVRLQQMALKQVEMSFSEASLFLRRTEQHLLREYSLRWSTE